MVIIYKHKKKKQCVVPSPLLSGHLVVLVLVGVVNGIVIGKSERAGLFVFVYERVVESV